VAGLILSCCHDLVLRSQQRFRLEEGGREKERTYERTPVPNRSSVHTVSPATSSKTCNILRTHRSPKKRNARRIGIRRGVIDHSGKLACAGAEDGSFARPCDSHETAMREITRRVFYPARRFVFKTISHGDVTGYVHARVYLPITG